MFDFEIDNSAIGRRVVRAVCDIAHRPLTGLRVLDLACAHGHYSFEMAKLGAQVLGIEGRESWLTQARQTQQELALANLEFVQDDVRNLSKEKYGEFDIVLCLGILYHLDAPDVFDFLGNVADVCRDFAIVETHIAVTPDAMHAWRGKQYWGTSCYEHDVNAKPEDKLKNVGASLDNPNAFWLTQASLCNILQHVGFTSVFDCRMPLANIYVGPDWIEKIWGNRVTLAAVKGQSLDLSVGPGTPPGAKTDWPENLDDYRFEDFLMEWEMAKVRSRAGEGAPRLAQESIGQTGAPAAQNTRELQAEVNRLRAQVDGYERGRFMRLMRWLHSKGFPTA